MSQKTCHECGVAVGKLHRPGCDYEECPACHGQKLECDCIFKILNVNVTDRGDLTVRQVAQWGAMLKALGRIPYGSETRFRNNPTLAQERRAFLGKPLTRSEMHRIYDKNWVLLEPIHWPEAGRWRERVGIVHAFTRKRDYKLLRLKIKTRKAGTALAYEYFGPPATVAFV